MQHIHWAQLDLTAGYEVSDKTGFFFTIILRLRKTKKAVYSLPSDMMNMFAL
jgi:hypothetical protein